MLIICQHTHTYQKRKKAMKITFLLFLNFSYAFSLLIFHFYDGIFQFAESCVNRLLSYGLEMIVRVVDSSYVRPNTYHACAYSLAFCLYDISSCLDHENDFYCIGELFDHIYFRYISSHPSLIDENWVLAEYPCINLGSAHSKLSALHLLSVFWYIRQIFWNLK